MKKDSAIIYLLLIVMPSAVFFGLLVCTILHNTGNIGQKIEVGGQYTHLPENPFEQAGVTNTVLAVSNGYVLYVNQFDRKDSSRIATFRRIYKDRVGTTLEK